jgi:radical SAM superfamily enzyme YgiQ (UPF0313 family)
MRRKVLLISPNRCTSPDPVFPLGLAHVSAALERAGHATRLLDVLADPQPLAEALHEFRPDFVGVSLRNIDDVLIRKQETFFDSPTTICETVRRVHPCPVVIGGSGFSIYPETMLQRSGADFGIQGEGEAGFVALLAALGDGGDYSDIPGLVYRRGTEIVANPQPRKPSGLAAQRELPTRPATLAAHYVSASGTLNLQTQRGCRHTCCYCTYPLIEGRTHRRRNPETVADEVVQLQQLGAKYAFIVDSVFNSSAEHVVETCEAILRRKARLRWGCFLRPQGLTPELMQLMKRAGLTHIEFGSDSFCDAVLEQYQKQLTFADILESSELARQAKIEHCHFLICGGPGETLETLETGFQNSLRLAGAIIMAVVGMRIYPGTTLAERARREGRLAANDDLLSPVYYLAPGLTEDAIFERLREFARRSPNWIAGDPNPKLASVVARLRGRGVVGPLWSYFAMLQRLMPQGAAEFTRAVPAT